MVKGIRSAGRLAGLACAAGLASSAWGQWDPPNAQWGKADANHLRVMTWNVQDGICSSSTRKKEQAGDWHALVCIVASLKPDVLLLQETGDNSGNGTGSGVDSVANLETTLELFMHGGSDPFEGGTVTSYVQKYAPGYDLPYIFVSNGQDGFNRNVIMSRHPFADLNGDGKSELSDIGFVSPDLWAPGGSGGIRGHMFAEIDLPDGTYAGDLVVGCAHLKSGSDSTDHDDRVRAAQNVGYWIYHLLGGGGTNTPDPRNKIGDNPQVQRVLDAETPVIWGGDWNEDEQKNGSTVGPADWFVRGGSLGGSDGTDRDTTDSTYDSATEYYTGNRTTQSSSKLDYIGWWDGTTSPARAHVFLSSAIPSGDFPAELYNYPTPSAPNPLLASNSASDHRPVFADFVVGVNQDPAPGPFALLAPSDGAMGVDRPAQLDWEDSSDATAYEVRIATDGNMTNVIHTTGGLTQSAYTAPASLLQTCATYYWGVRASNGSGTTESEPYPAAFRVEGVADFNGDGTINTLDVLSFLNAWSAGSAGADVNVDGTVNTLDVLFFLNNYTAGC